MNLREAAQQALEALEAHADFGIKSDKAITALRAALADIRSGGINQTSKPVAWMYDWDADGTTVLDWVSTDYDEAHSPTMGCHNIRPLYAAPPKRNPLTDEEISKIIESVADSRLAGPLDILIRAAERAWNKDKE